MTDHCTSCGKPFVEHMGIVGTCAELMECRSMLLDCWQQFRIEVEIDGETWHSDGCLSTLEDIADYLYDHGMLTMHHSRRVYKLAAPDPVRPADASVGTTQDA